MRVAEVASSPHLSVPVTLSSREVWAGRTLSALLLLFLAFDTIIKVLRMPVAVEATRELGFTESAVFAVGVVEALCLVIYLIPRTAILGAVVWTAYFGGAIATHLRAGSPLFTHTLFPIYLAIFLWVGLALRDGRLRRIVHTALNVNE